tara:strand:- start:1471 stop:2766 length:1296 start_codon:yes stop_codon:yes gene_type:complete
MRRILASMVILGACTPEYGIKDHRNVPNITPDTQTTVDSPVEDPPFIVGTPEIHEKNPLILIDPYEYTFEDILVNCSDEYNVRIANIGDAILDIYEWEYIHTPNLSMIPLSEPPFSLEPGEETSISFFFDENNIHFDIGSLYISSNALGKPEQMVRHEGQGEAWGSQADSFKQEEITKADILFVIDNSCSMSEEQTDLAANAEDFIDTLVSKGTDFQISVVTTDNPVPSASLITSASADPVAEFAAAVQVGVMGSAFEHGQDNAMQALDTGPLSSGRYGREDASLSVVVISDEEDQSPLTEIEYNDFFLTIKDSDLFFFHSITGLIGSVCDTEVGLRYMTQSGMTGGTTLDICGSWGGNLNTIASTNYVIFTVYPLSEEPLVNTIQIFLDGIPWDGAWYFDYTANSVVLESTTGIIGDETLQITYDFVREC